MGLDLNLLPVNGDHLPSIFFSHLILDIDRNAIIDDIAHVAHKHGVPLPQPLRCFLGHREDGETGYGAVTHDPYGAQLKYVLAKYLKPLAKTVGATAPWKAKVGYKSRLNRAAFAFIRALPDDYKIVIYWH